jgi:hypothetical protein
MDIHRRDLEAAHLAVSERGGGHWFPGDVARFHLLQPSSFLVLAQEPLGFLALFIPRLRPPFKREALAACPTAMRAGSLEIRRISTFLLSAAE